MTYPDDVLKAAEEIALSENWDAVVPLYVDGRKAAAVIAKAVAARAIMAERQRCAEKADKQNWPSAKQTKTGDVRSFLQGFCAACDDIKAAILGQQEASNAQP